MDPIGSLILAAKRGETAALGMALESFRGYLLAVARGEMEPDLLAKGGASDLVQDAFLEAHRDFERFEGGDADDLCVWLRGILMHRLANFRRHYRQTEKRRIGREVALPPPGGPQGWEFSDRDPSPSREFERRERSKVLRNALERLAEKHRAVILLRHEERLTFGEIGLRVGISEEAARKRWGRAVERLREELEGSHERR
jgi:RNA polymerase sigma-70 factor (ECF subfamily)